jgi:hypothetical protein
MRVGVIAEGERDCVAYDALIRKLRNDIESVIYVPCNGRIDLKKFFVGYLKSFQYGYPPIQKAFIIRDSDCRDTGPCEAELKSVLTAKHFTPDFSVDFHATKCELETWLLSDETALNTVARRRGRRGQVARLQIQLESHNNAKEIFISRLSQFRPPLPDDPAVYGEVANAANVETISERCPNFREFSAKVRAN